MNNNTDWYKKSKLHLFNPENDLCLANGGEDYMPPISARRIAYDLSALPLWYAGENDYVLLSEEMIFDTFSPICHNGINIKNQDELVNILPKIQEIVPWGWSAAVTKRFKNMGVLETHLPNGSQLEKHRQLSSRISVVKLLKALSDDGFDPMPSIPIILETPSEIQNFISSNLEVMLKAPWSGSGKGLYHSNGKYDTPVERWTNGILKRQKAIIGEPFYHKIADFAMEFWSNGNGTVQFEGYSFFYTDDKGAYKGNLIAQNEQIEKKITTYCDKKTLQNLKEWLIRYLTKEIASNYRGYLGIDMLCYTLPGEQKRYYLHPCVEINLRMNMGIVAQTLGTKYVVKESTGKFHINYNPLPGQLEKQHHEMQERYPLHLRNGKIEKGYFSFTPVKKETCYQAYILLENNDD